jgi:hypothetical protein
LRRPPKPDGRIDRITVVIEAFTRTQIGEHRNSLGRAPPNGFDHENGGESGMLDTREEIFGSNTSRRLERKSEANLATLSEAAP